jgi:hypothetical protein
MLNSFGVMLPNYSRMCGKQFCVVYSAHIGFEVQGVRMTVMLPSWRL